MFEFLLIALAFCGLPLIPLAYAALAVGRRLGGEAGMNLGAGIGILIAALPFLYLCFDMARRVAQGISLVPVYADQYWDFILLGTSSVTILATAAVFAISWPAQSARIRSAL